MKGLANKLQQLTVDLGLAASVVEALVAACLDDNDSKKKRARVIATNTRLTLMKELGLQKLSFEGMKEIEEEVGRLKVSFD
jgi:hypothetical protein